MLSTWNLRSRTSPSVENRSRCRGIFRRLRMLSCAIRSPAACEPPSTKSELEDRPLTLHWRELTTTADIPTKKEDRSTFRGVLRHRGELTRRMFVDANAAPGDVVIFEQMGSHEIRLHVEKPDGTKISSAPKSSPEIERIKKWAMRETRPVQQEFRRKVAERDRLKYAISGCAIPEVLDAAHLAPRAPGGSDDPANGIILRVDLHRLVDADLLSMDGTGTISVSSEVTAPDYRGVDGHGTGVCAAVRKAASSPYATFRTNLLQANAQPDTPSKPRISFERTSAM